MLDAVREVAARRGWPSTWLNEQAAVYAPRETDPAPRSLFSSPSLAVFAGSPEYMLAMKLQAARAADADDLRLLLDACKIAEPAEALAIHDRFFPDRPAGERQKRFLNQVRAAAPQPPNGGG